jgi:drug/metabolite transporter (DMT)-like permease
VTAERGPDARLRAALFVLVAGASFATSSPLSRWARPADPLVIAFGRLALAAIVLLALDVRHIARSFRGMTLRQRLLALGAGATLAAHFACFQWGLDHTSLPAAASLIALEPTSVVLTAWVFFKIAPRRIEYVALALATAGAAVVGSAAGSGEHHLVGDLMVLVAVVLIGFYLAIARGLRDALPTRSYVAIVYSSAALCLGFVVHLTGRAAAVQDLSNRSALGIVLLALVPTVIGHTAVQAASRALPPSIVALASPAETLGSIAIAAAWLGESPSAKELAGAALILGGTTLALTTAPKIADLS